MNSSVSQVQSCNRSDITISPVALSTTTGLAQRFAHGTETSCVIAPLVAWTQILSELIRPQACKMYGWANSWPDLTLLAGLHGTGIVRTYMLQTLEH